VGFLRKQRGVLFVRRAPTKSGQDLPIHIAKMTAPQVLWWHSHVQPIIDRDPTRADSGWSWLLCVPFAEVAGRVLMREPVGYAVGLSDPERDRFNIIEQVLPDLLAQDGAAHEREVIPVYPDRAPLPSLRASPAVPTPLLAEEWRQLLRRLAARLRNRD